SNNTVTTYNDTVTLATSDAQASLPSSLGLSNGTGTFTATLKTAGNQTITAADSVAPSLTGQGAVTVSAASVAQLRFQQQPPPVTDRSRRVAGVTALDGSDNAATPDTPDVVPLRWQTPPAGALLSGTASVTLAGGMAMFPTVQISKPGTNLKLLASSGALAGA